MGRTAAGVWVASENSDSPPQGFNSCIGEKIVKVEISELVCASVHCDAEQVESVQTYLDKYPVLRRAVLLHSFARDGYMAQREIRGTIHAFDVLRVGSLIDRVNSRFPGDSFSPTTILALLTGSFLDVEEFDIVEKAVPDYSGSRRARVSAVPGGVLTVTFEHSMKHSGMYYEVSFSGVQGLVYPVTVGLRTFMDMDDLRNHWEGGDDCCESGDCNCEAEVAFEGELVIQDNFDAGVVGEWLELHLFEGQL
jgi:hypothetical protein